MPPPTFAPLPLPSPAPMDQMQISNFWSELGASGKRMLRTENTKNFGIKDYPLLALSLWQFDDRQAADGFLVHTCQIDHVPLNLQYECLSVICQGNTLCKYEM